MNEEKIISVGNSYKSLYYINPRFTNLPKEVLNKIQIFVVTLSEKTKGIVKLSYTDDGSIALEVQGLEEDFGYDDINAQIEVGRAKEENKELIQGLISYYKIFVDTSAKELLKNMSVDDIEKIMR